MLEYTCSCCGQVHQGLADLAFAAPYYYYTVPEPERSERCRLDTDLCVIDERDYFIRGCLEIPVVGLDSPFTYGVWCSLSPENFHKYVEIFDEPHQSHLGPFFGWFSVQPPGYPDTLRLKVMAHLRDHRTRPWFDLERTDHPLAVEHHEGISQARLQEIYELNLHPRGPAGR